MTTKRSDKQRLDALMDAICEDIINMPDELLLREAKANGLNIREESSKVSDLINQALGNTTNGHMTVFDATKNALEKARKTYIPTVLPNTAEARRDLLRQLIKGDHPLSDELTLAFRDITELSDDDVQGILENLSELNSDISKK